MMDFWEIIGRAVTDYNFRTGLFWGPYQAPYAVNSSSRAAIPKADYDTAIGAMRGAGMATRPPLSVFAVGEILHDISIAGFQNEVNNVATTIQNSGVGIHPQDVNFYVGLGAMIVDAPLQVQLQAGSFDANGFSNVQPADRATLQTLFDPNLHPEVIRASASLCARGWGTECFVKALFWPPNHTHPVVQ